MKQFWQGLSRYSPWLFLLLAVDSFAALLVWLVRGEAFRALVGMIVLWSLMLFSIVLLTISIKERKKRSLFTLFLTKPTAETKENLFCAVSRQEQEQLQLLAEVLQEQQRRMRQLQDDLQDYEEYAESWAHEAKTPLSLLTMLLDNRGDEMPDTVRRKLDYVCSQLQEDITQMLYYARLKSSTKDYRFENVCVSQVLEEVLEDYAPLLEEKQFTVHNHTGGAAVFTDRRGLAFILGQLVSNAVKYSGNAPQLTVTLTRTEQQDVLSVTDNGVGVKSYELPYIFQKGFTGDSTDSRKKATGMGLYLTRKMADDLNLKIDAQSEWGKGLSVSIAFPRVRHDG